METPGTSSSSAINPEFNHIAAGAVVQLSPIAKVGETVVEAPAAAKSNLKSWRKWGWALLAGYVVLQTYYVREMLAALLLFTVLFAIFAVIATVVYIVGRAGEAGIVLAEPAAKRGLVLAEELSKKTFHRPRSVPAP